MNADETLFMTDTEIIRRLGVPEKTARAAIQELAGTELSRRRTR